MRRKNLNLPLPPNCSRHTPCAVRGLRHTECAYYYKTRQLILTRALRPWLLVLVLGLLTLFGCSNSGRHGVEGTVTLDGQPLPKALITFRPKPGTASPSAGANVVDGKFSIASKGGLLPGKFRVEITAMRPTNKQRTDPFSGKMVTLDEQYIPAKYNTASELEAVIGPDAAKPLDFQLASKNP
jgi:hypothetical protein